jgi:hypothetical protein
MARAVPYRSLYGTFTDAESGGGAVLYHRYDGHYGLLFPTDEEPP